MLRRGMWVKDEGGRVGIYLPEKARLNTGNGEVVEIAVHEFHWCSASGETIAVLRMFSAEGLTQADYADIPEPRRSGLTRQQFARLGYR